MTPSEAGCAREAPILTPFEKALSLVLSPSNETTPKIVARVQKLLAKMTVLEVTEFKRRIRQINEAPREAPE
jgi:hypothetical protein